MGYRPTLDFGFHGYVDRSELDEPQLAHFEQARRLALEELAGKRAVLALAVTGDQTGSASPRYPHVVAAIMHHYELRAMPGELAGQYLPGAAPEAALLAD